MADAKVARRKFFKRTVQGGIGRAVGAAFADRILELWTAHAEHGTALLDLHQMMTLAAIAAQIIPTDDVPGAKEAGVVEYINAKLKETPSLLPLYQSGFQEIDSLSKSRFSGLFLSLSEAQQQEVLQSLEKSKFFAQVWKDTVEGFSRSWVGRKVVGYPGGAQAHGYHDISSPPKQ